MKVSNEETIKQPIDIINLIEQLEEKYKDIYWMTIDNEIYIYKPLGRKDYTEISKAELDSIEQEDEICKRTLLYPDPDTLLENGKAGIPTILANKILVESKLDSVETRKAVRKYFIMEMDDVNNQIDCIIHEAFPEFNIEDISNWGIERTCKYLAMAEWSLSTFRNAEFDYSFLNEKENKQNNKEKMTPEELKKIKEKFPEVSVNNEMKEEDLNVSYDTTPPALRPGFFKPKLF